MSDDQHDDHLIFGHDPAVDDRSSRHARGGADDPVDADDDDSDDGGPAGGDAYETRPAPIEPRSEGEATHPYVDVSREAAGDGGYPHPPTFVEPPDWSTPSYAERPAAPEPETYADPPPFAEPPVYADPTPFTEPPSPYTDPPAWQAPAGYADRYVDQPHWNDPYYAQPGYTEPQGYEQPQGFEQPQGYEQSQGFEQPVQPSGNYSPDAYPQPPAAPAAPDPSPRVAAFADPTDVAATIRRGELPGSDPVPQSPPPAPPAPAPPAASAQGYAAAPAVQPRPEDLLVPTKSDVSIAPASWGWRGRVNRGSGGLFKTKAAPAELAAREAIVRIQRSFSRPMTVVVVQPKGGAGKTPTTICLSAAFGAHRGGYVVGWDDNETRGTLAVRVRNPDNQQATVWDLLSKLSDFERQDARVGDLGFYVRAQPDAHFDALVSDDNPGNMAQIGDDEFQRLHQVLQRFYRMIVVDTGNNVRSANWQAAVNAADLIVVVSTYQRDVGFSASWVLDHLAQTGREGLARNAVTVLTAADPTSDKQVRSELMAHFSQRTRAVVEIPYDPELAHGGPIGWMQLQEATRNAWVEAGATVADALSEHEQREMQARRS